MEIPPPAPLPRISPFNFFGVFSQSISYRNGGVMYGDAVYPTVTDVSSIFDRSGTPGVARDVAAPLVPIQVTVKPAATSPNLEKWLELSEDVRVNCPFTLITSNALDEEARYILKRCQIFGGLGGRG